MHLVERVSTMLVALPVVGSRVRRTVARKRAAKTVLGASYQPLEAAVVTH
jgi:hypothetical protein